MSSPGTTPCSARPKPRPRRRLPGRRMTTALVTGAAGFLGTAIVARLRTDGVRVRAFVRPGRACAGADERCEGDLRDEAALARAVAGADWVVHAGARVATTGPWEEFEATNVQATATLLRLATEAGAR